MSPIQILTEKLGPHDAKIALDAIKDGGWIIVGKDAIKLAQAHALADNDNQRRAA